MATSLAMGTLLLILMTVWRYIGISLLKVENIHLNNYAGMKVGVGGFSGCGLILE